MARDLRIQLQQRGHDADIIALPFKWYPPGHILECMLGARLVDLSEVNGMKIDRVIALKFPAYYLRHDRKVLWMLHQHRQAYDLYGTEHSDLSPTAEGREVAREIRRWDNEFLAQYSIRCTIARTVTRRLKKFNGLDSTVLHTPLSQTDQYTCSGYEDFVYFPSRFGNMKRQHLLLDAIELMPPGLKAVFTGQTDSVYGRELLARIENSPLLRERVEVLGWVSDSTKLDLYARCKAVYYGVYDEDYGFGTVEAFYSSKPIITHGDSGGPLEFVDHGFTGWVVPPTGEAIAECLSEIMATPDVAREFGQAARASILKADLSWDRVISTLLA